MTTFFVSIRIDADSSDEAISRISEWNLGETEGVMNISAQPDVIQIPQEIAAPVPMPADPPPPEVTVPEENGNGTSV